jgi:DedD protein
MAKQTTEEEFNLMRLTRRRLIGAVALVLLVVILLPIVFDSEPAPATGNDIELRIPNKDNAGEFQPKIDLPELDKMASAVAAASDVASAPAVIAVPAVAVVPTPVPKPVATAPAVTQPKPEAKPKPEVKPKPVAKPKVEPKLVAKPQAVPKTGFAVQVGAFANSDTAKGLQAKLSKQGYHAYTEKAGNVIRVRVGGYPTREAAEKIQGRLAAHGTQGNVVTLE